AQQASSTTATSASGTYRCRWKEVPILFRAALWALPHPCLTVYELMYRPNHAPIGLFRAPKWATHRIGAGQPIAWQPCLFPGLQRGVDTPVRTRALTWGAVCAWMALPPGVWRQRWWHASRSRQRGAARPRARPQLPQQPGRAAAVGDGGCVTRVLPRRARCHSLPWALGV